MTKKLNTDHIRSELADSVFFRPRQQSASPEPQRAALAPDPTEPAPAAPRQ